MGIHRIRRGSVGLRDCPPAKSLVQSSYGSLYPIGLCTPWSRARSLPLGLLCGGRLRLREVCAMVLLPADIPR
jgi:hypothetical protein